jgi:ribulose bisphosphate carboxylase small subunit
MFNLPKHDDVITYITDWNIDYPIDRWWREKYHIAFNSQQHRSVSFIDQLLDYEEDKLFERLLKQHKEGEETEEQYKRGKGNWLNRSTMSVKEVDEAFDNLDLSKFNDKKE